MAFIDASPLSRIQIYQMNCSLIMSRNLSPIMLKGGYATLRGEKRGKRRALEMLKFLPLNADAHAINPHQTDHFKRVYVEYVGS